MELINFSLRINCASRYHNFLANHLESSWLEIFFKIEQDSKYSIPEVMTLLHPRWHDQLRIIPSTDPRGNSVFSAVSNSAKCHSVEIWGYECPYEDFSIHVDHTFPRARGGATSIDNAMYLCSEHNLSKHSDLHMIPWETFPSKNWIKLQLQNIILKAQPLTNERLYFPEQKFKID